ncbi:MAG TPA: DUF2203 domain-containing protein [Pyrinomonadaceae bacterium]|nr:DUF2203 domain-containing protein [Pyrinomonadaceae bacterium]
MRLFTVSEAEALVPTIRERLLSIRRYYSVIDTYRPAARAAAEASISGGGMAGGSHYLRALYDVGRLTTEINDLGVQLKDHSQGLVDFPSMRDGRVVLLCWKLGEPEEIAWWHEVDAGFAGRQPI